MPNDYQRLDTHEEVAVERYSLNVGETANSLDGKILITLSGVEFVPNPFRHVVSGSVGVPGKENTSFESVDPGYRLVYEGYEVRVNSSRTSQATFSVMKLDE